MLTTRTKRPICSTHKNNIEHATSTTDNKYSYTTQLCEHMACVVTQVAGSCCDARLKLASMFLRGAVLIFFIEPMITGQARGHIYRQTAMYFP